MGSHVLTSHASMAASMLRRSCSCALTGCCVSLLLLLSTMAAWVQVQHTHSTPRTYTNIHQAAGSTLSG